MRPWSTSGEDSERLGSWRDQRVLPVFARMAMTRPAFSCFVRLSMTA
jgi:hypothetical protein